MRISDWSSDVCSSDLAHIREGERQISGHKKPVSDRHGEVQRAVGAAKLRTAVYASSSNITADPDPEIDRRPFALDCRPTSHIETEARLVKIGRASCRERVCQYV